MAGTPVAELSSYFGIVGGHFESPDQAKFVKVFAELSNLHEWTCRSALALTRSETGEGWQVTQGSIPDIPLGKHEGFDFALRFTAELTPGFGDFRLSEKCVLKVESEEMSPYESFEEAIHRFQEFVSLGISRPVYPLSISAHQSKPPQVFRGGGKFGEFEIIQQFKREDSQRVVIGSHEMQFCLPDLKPNPDEFVKRYFDKFSLLKPVCELYFSTLFHQEMYVTQQFLSLAHAIEAYHRTSVGGKYQDDHSYRNGLEKILWAAIPEDVDANFRASLKNKLKYLHEFSLRKRVQDICDRHAALVQPYLGDLARFSGEVSEQRNRLTHPDTAVEGQSAEMDWSNIWLKSEQLSLLIEVCLLHEIGFSDESISKLLPRNRRTHRIQLNKR